MSVILLISIIINRFNTALRSVMFVMFVILHDLFHQFHLTNNREDINYPSMQFI